MFLIEPYVVIGKGVKIGNNVKILSFSYIEKTKIGNNVTIEPFARLRPDTVLELTKLHTGTRWYLAEHNAGSLPEPVIGDDAVN